MTHGQQIKFTLTAVDKDYYSWLTFLEQGPIKWLDEPEEDIAGKAHRICITTSDIYNNLYIEQVTFGMEGCCKKIVTKNKLDLYELFNQYQLTGEIANVSFILWIDFDTCLLKIKGATFQLDIESDKLVKITKDKNGL